jgi:hypothetical protein
VNHCWLPQISLPLCRLVGKKMTSARLISLHLTRASEFEALFRALMSFDFWHYTPRNYYSELTSDHIPIWVYLSMIMAQIHNFNYRLSSFKPVRRPRFLEKDGNENRSNFKNISRQETQY